MLNNSESLSSDEKIYLKFHHKRLDQFCHIVKEFREKLNVSDLNESQFDEYFEYCVGNLTKFFDNDQYLETFIVFGASVHCPIWNGLYSKITSFYSMKGSPITNMFLSRIPRYRIIFQDLRKYLENETSIEKCNFILSKLESLVSNTFWNKYTFHAHVKKNSEFLQAIELYNFDFILLGLQFEIFDSKTENQDSVESGSVAISKMGELLLFKPNSIIIDLSTFENHLDSDSGVKLENEIELIKTLDIKDVLKFRLIYGEEGIQINSKEFRIVVRFKKNEFQISMWNTLMMKRQTAPSFLKFRNYQDVNFSFE